MWDNTKYRGYTTELLLKHSAVCGPPAFLGMLRKVLVRVPALPWQVRLFWDLLSSIVVSSSLTVPVPPGPCARRVPRHQVRSGLGGKGLPAAPLCLPEVPRACGSVKQAIWCLRGRNQLCSERQRSVNPPRCAQVKLGGWRCREAAAPVRWRELRGEVFLWG